MKANSTRLWQCHRLTCGATQDQAELGADGSTGDRVVMASQNGPWGGGPTFRKRQIKRANEFKFVQGIPSSSSDEMIGK